MVKPAHTNIRALDPERSIAFYRDALGLRVVDRLPFEDFDLIFLRGEDSEFELELTWNHGQTEPYSHCSAYGHFAVSTDDILGIHAECTRNRLGPTPVKDLYSNGNLAVRFFFLTDPDGCMVEIVEQQGRYT